MLTLVNTTLVNTELMINNTIWFWS